MTEYVINRHQLMMPINPVITKEEPKMAQYIANDKQIAELTQAVKALAEYQTKIIRELAEIKQKSTGREFATPAGCQVEIDQDGNVCRVM